MWSTDASREQFIEILHSGFRSQCIVGKFATNNKSTLKRVRKREVRLLWSDKPLNGEIPQIIVVRDSEIDDFFAWANTYLTSWSPISAYFRVLTEGEQIDSDKTCSSVPEKSIELASLGLIIAEALTYSERVYRVGQIPSNWCLATFSFVAAQGAKTADKLDSLAEKWLECRKLTNQSALSLDVGNLLQPWRTLLYAVECQNGKSSQVSNLVQSIFVACLFEVMHRGEISTEVWRGMTRNCKAAADAAELMHGNRENRVNVFENFVKDMRSAMYKDTQEFSFIAGYLASRISPGTFDQASMLQSELDLFPSSILWLGILASLNEKEQLSSSSIGRKIWKELGNRQSYFSRPRSDIGLRELRVLAQGGSFEEGYKTDISGSLIVELEPWISTRVRWPVHNVAAEQRAKSKLENQNGELNEIVSILDQVKVGITAVEDKLKVISVS